MFEFLVPNIKSGVTSIYAFASHIILYIGNKNMTGGKKSGENPSAIIKHLVEREIGRETKP